MPPPFLIPVGFTVLSIIKSNYVIVIKIYNQFTFWMAKEWIIQIILNKYLNKI